MNTAQFKLISVFSIFAVIGFGPISPGCLIGMFIVWKRPRWFLRLIRDLYRDKAPATKQIKDSSTTTTRIKTLLVLIGLFIVDILPYPVTPTLAFFIIFTRPDWFLSVVVGVYYDKG